MQLGNFLVQSGNFLIRSRNFLIQSGSLWKSTKGAYQVFEMPYLVLVERLRLLWQIFLYRKEQCGELAEQIIGKSESETCLKIFNGFKYSLQRRKFNTIQFGNIDIVIRLCLFFHNLCCLVFQA